MGSMTLLDFRDEVKLILENRNDDAITDTRLDRWVNQMYTHLCHPSTVPFNQMKAESTVPLVADQYQYPFSTIGSYTIIGFRSIYYTDSTDITTQSRRYRLRPRNIRVFDQALQRNSFPYFYDTEENETLTVWPVPNADAAGKFLNVRVWREPTVLALDTDKTVVPSYYDNAVVLGASALAMSRLGYRDKALEQLELYQAFVNDVSPKEVLDADDWDHRAEVKVPMYMELTQ